jgi:tetratricopeptide (TPR) repeat protein
MLQMTPTRKKWALRVGALALIGAGALFLLRLTERSESTAPPARPAAVQDNPAHELKELAVQLEKKPGHLPVLMRMAQLEHDQGKLAEAEAHLREALAGEPENADLHLELGRVLYEKGDRNEALKETERALAINPKHADALYNMGAIHANLGDTGRARSYWEKLIASAPESESGKKAREGLARLGGGQNPSRRSP